MEKYKFADLPYEAVVPMYLILDKEVIPQAKFLYAIICLNIVDGYCHSATKYFRELFSASDSVIFKWLKSLKNQGYIDIMYHRPSGKRFIKVMSKKTNIDTKNTDDLE